MLRATIITTTTTHTSNTDIRQVAESASPTKNTVQLPSFLAYSEVPLGLLEFLDIFNLNSI